MMKRIKALFVRHALLPVKVQIVPRDPLRITLDEWRKEPSLVKEAMDVLRDQRVRRMLDCLRTSHMAFNTAPLTMQQDALASLWRQNEGYQLALNNFEALGSLQKAEEALESTFEPDPRE
jgi:hypothetical protein